MQHPRCIDQNRFTLAGLALVLAYMCLDLLGSQHASAATTTQQSSTSAFTVPPGGRVQVTFVGFCLDSGSSLPLDIKSPDANLNPTIAPNPVQQALNYIKNNKLDSDPQQALEAQYAIWRLLDRSGSPRGGALADQIIKKSGNILLANPSGQSIVEKAGFNQHEWSLDITSWAPLGQPVRIAADLTSHYYGRGQMMVKNNTKKQLLLYMPDGTIFPPTSPDSCRVTGYLTGIQVVVMPKTGGGGLLQGRLEYTHPQQMKIGEPDVFTVEIIADAKLAKIGANKPFASDRIDGKAIFNDGSRERKEASVDLYQEMMVELLAPGFDPIGDKNLCQEIVPGSSAIWVWDLRAQEAGKYRLTLNVRGGTKQDKCDYPIVKTLFIDVYVADKTFVEKFLNSLPEKVVDILGVSGPFGLLLAMFTLIKSIKDSKALGVEIADLQKENKDAWADIADLQDENEALRRQMAVLKRYIDAFLTHNTGRSRARGP